MSRPTINTPGLHLLGRFSYSSLLILMLVCPVVAQAQEQDQPGSSHPKLDNQVCFDCHQCAAPTANDPCLKSCLRSRGEHGVGRQPSAEYPEVIIIDELLELYKPVVFAHKYHADMSKMGAGCTECHHYSPAGNYPACKECHEAAVTSLDRPNINQPGLKGAYHQQCLDCHIAWSNTTGCNFCHLSIEQALAGKDIRGEGDSYHLSQPRIKSEARYVYETEYEDGPMVTFYHDNHVDMFGLECADCHQGDACGSCHRIGAIARVKGDLHEDCSTCHDENDCTICHRSSVAPAFSHAAKSGWELGAQHENLACSACHNTARASGMLSSSCGECHQSWEVGNFDHAVTGLALNIEHAELDCESCHGDPLFANTPICSSCHDGDVAYPEDVPGARSNDN